MAIVTAAVPKDVLFADLLGRRDRPVATRSSTRSSTTCTPRCGCSPRPRSLGAGVSLLRPPTHAVAEAVARRVTHGLRIGEVAERARTTPRTIRYYEEIGLLGGGERAAGRAIAPTGRRTSSACGGAAPEGAARRPPGRAARAGRRRARACRAALGMAQRRGRRRRSGRFSAKRSATRNASSSWSAIAARRSPASRTS